MANTDKPHVEQEKEKKIVIHIDHKEYKTTKEVMTGTELRALAVPPVSGDYDLWLEVPGPGDDRKIGDNEHEELRNGMHFYSVLRQINPGATRHGTT